MDEGYIKIYRRFFEHDLWIEERVLSKAEAWIDILRSARFDAGTSRMLVGNTRIEIERGEWAISVRFLAERWGWGRNKVDNYLKFLRDEGMIRMGTATGTQQTILTVCNYNTYNPVGIITGTPEVTPPPRGHHGDTKRDTAGDTDHDFNNVNINEMSGSNDLRGDTAGDTDFSKTGTKNKKKEEDISLKKNKKKNDFDLEFVDPKFRGALDTWLAYKRSRGQTYKSQQSIEALYTKIIKLSGNRVDVASAIIEQSMANNWAGLFPLKNDGNGSTTNGTSAKTTVPTDTDGYSSTI